MRLTIILSLISVILTVIAVDYRQRVDKRIESYAETIDFLIEYNQTPYSEDWYLTRNKIQKVMDTYYIPKIDSASLNEIADAIHIYSKLYSVQEELVIAIIAQESGFNRLAISPTGAEGLGQLLPATARQVALVLGIDTYDTFNIYDNIRLSTKYIAMLLEMFKGNRWLAVRAYNGGPLLVHDVLHGNAEYTPEVSGYYDRVFGIYNMLVKDNNKKHPKTKSHSK